MISMLDCNASSSCSLFETIVSPDGLREDGAVCIMYDEKILLLGTKLGVKVNCRLTSGIENLRQQHHSGKGKNSCRKNNFDQSKEKTIVRCCDGSALQIFCTPFHHPILDHWNKKLFYSRFMILKLLK